MRFKRKIIGFFFLWNIDFWTTTILGMGRVVELFCNKRSSVIDATWKTMTNIFTRKTQSGDD